jgi:hypothetical protein
VTDTYAAPTEHKVRAEVVAEEAAAAELAAAREEDLLLVTFSRTVHYVCPFGYCRGASTLPSTCYILLVTRSDPAHLA